MCETGVRRPPLVYGNSRIASADSPSRLPKKINFFQIDNFVSEAAQDRFECEQTKARGLFKVIVAGGLSSAMNALLAEKTCSLTDHLGACRPLSKLK